MKSSPDSVSWLAPDPGPGRDAVAISPSGLPVEKAKAVWVVEECSRVRGPDRTPRWPEAGAVNRQAPTPTSSVTLKAFLPVAGGTLTDAEGGCDGSRVGQDRPDVLHVPRLLIVGDLEDQPVRP